MTNEDVLNKAILLKNSEQKIKGLLSLIPSAKTGKDQEAILIKIFSIMKIIQKVAFTEFLGIVQPIENWIKNKEKETVKFCKTITFFSLVGNKFIISKKNKEESFDIIPAETLLEKMVLKDPDFSNIQLAYLLRNENFILAQLYFHGVENE
jgi:hypothetical protein